MMPPSTRVIGVLLDAVCACRRKLVSVHFDPFRTLA